MRFRLRGFDKYDIIFLACCAGTFMGVGIAGEVPWLEWAGITLFIIVLIGAWIGRKWGGL